MSVIRIIRLKLPLLNFGTRRERGQFPLPFVSNWFYNEKHLFRPEVTTGPLVPPEAKKIPSAFSFREPNRILKLDWSEFVQLNSSYSDYK